jgi:hypothetical protein
VYAKASQAAVFFTIDPTKKTEDSKSSLRLSPFGSVFKILLYNVLDFLIAILIPWIFGSSILK